MKKIYLIASALLLALSSTSCLKELDNPQKGAISMLDYYTNADAEDAEKLIARTYNRYFGSIESTTTGNFLDIISDDNLCGGGTWADNANQYRDAQELTLTVSSWPFRSTYQSIYAVIYYCNLIIEKIPESNDATINRVKAEAKFLRAASLFEAMRWYRNPPFADHVYGADDMLAENGDPAEMIKWILDNFEEAAATLPVVPGKGQQIKIGGRATSGAAWAYYGKAALWYATANKDNSYLSKAITAFKKVMDSGLYDLIPDVADIGRCAADFSCEYLFERNCAETNQNKNIQNDQRQTWRSLRNDNVDIPSQIVGYGWSFCNPSKEFVEFMKEHDGEDNVRFKSKLLSYDEMIAMGSTGLITGRYCPDCVGYFNATALMWVADVYPDTGNSFWSRANVAYMRYAEVLLMYAEAQFLENGDSDGSGLAALNKVRARAQLPALTKMTYQDIKDERRAELFTEEERFFDLLRWGEAAEVLKDRGKVRYEFWGYKEGTKEYDVREKAGMGHGWDSKYSQFPYSDAQLLANPNLQQAPGW